MSFIWNRINVEHLRDMWLKGLTASQIASAIGNPSRNSVISKAARIGLPGRASPIGAPSKSIVHRERKPRVGSNNPAGRPPAVAPQRVRELLAQGLRGDQIAERLGISPSYVSRIKNRPASYPTLKQGVHLKSIAGSAQYAARLRAEPLLPLPGIEDRHTHNIQPRPAPHVPSVAIVSGRKRFRDLEPDECRFIAGVPVRHRADEAMACGEKQVPGSQWCAHHRDVCTIRKQPEVEAAA